jgi:hypothetical protein
MVIISLPLDVARNRIFIAVLAYGTCEIAVRPKLSTPKLFLHVGTLPEYFPCRNAFDRRNNFRYSVCWDGLDEEMHVILIRTDLKEFHLIPFLDLYADIFHHAIHISVKDRTSVFGRKYQVIDKYRNIMALMYVLAHIGILRRKRRGIQPEGNSNQPEINKT